MILISSASAFNPGSNLWVLPESSQCKWTLRIDYYLNFIILKNKRLPTPRIPKELKDILEKTEVFSTTQNFSRNVDSGLLIFSENALPSQWTFYQPISSGDHKAWISKVYKTWQGLNSPSLRFFLPQGLTPSELESEWIKLTDFMDFTVVNEAST